MLTTPCVSVAIKPNAIIIKCLSDINKYETLFKAFVLVYPPPYILNMSKYCLIQSLPPCYWVLILCNIFFRVNKMADAMIDNVFLYLVILLSIFRFLKQKKHEYNN